mgnify:CR=1 FL=1
MLLIPDLDTFVIYPWDDESGPGGGRVARLICDVHNPDGTPFDGCPRLCLKRSIEAAAKLGITVTNVRGYATSSVVQHVFAMILHLTRRLDDYNRAAVDGRWAGSRQFCVLDRTIDDLEGQRLGVIGYGELGSAVARTAECFGMEVLVAQRQGAPRGTDRLPLEELLPKVDVLTLHCPLTEETRGLIDGGALAAMKESAILINAARGGIVDEAALAEALRSGRLAGAGVDVLSTEPPRDGNPLLAADIPNLVVTPHVAWASRRSRQRLLDGVAENIERFAGGDPINVVTPD